MGGIGKERKPKGVTMVCKNPCTFRVAILDSQAYFAKPSPLN